MIAIWSDRLIKARCVMSKKLGTITLSTPGVEDRFSTTITDIMQPAIGHFVLNSTFLLIFLSTAADQVDRKSDPQAEVLGKNIALVSSVYLENPR